MFVSKLPRFPVGYYRLETFFVFSWKIILTMDTPGTKNVILQLNAVQDSYCLFGKTPEGTAIFSLTVFRHIRFRRVRKKILQLPIDLAEEFVLFGHGFALV